MRRTATYLAASGPEMRTPVPQHRRSLSPKDPVVEGDRAVPWCVR